MATPGLELKNYREHLRNIEVIKNRIFVAVSEGPESLEKTLASISDEIGSKNLEEIINSDYSMFHAFNEMGSQPTASRHNIEKSILDRAFKIIRIFLLYGGNANQCDGFGMTPLHYSTADIAELLIMHGADASVISKTGQSPLNMDNWDIRRSKILLNNLKTVSYNDFLSHFKIYLSRFFLVDRKEQNELLEIMDLWLSKIPPEMVIHYFQSAMRELYCKNFNTNEMYPIYYKDEAVYEAFVAMLAKYFINKISCPEIFEGCFKPKKLNVYFGRMVSGIKNVVARIKNFSLATVSFQEWDTSMMFAPQELESPDRCVEPKCIMQRNFNKALTRLCASFLKDSELSHFCRTARFSRDACQQDRIDRKKVKEELLPHIFSGNPDEVERFLAKPGVNPKILLTKVSFKEGYMSRKRGRFVCFREWRVVSAIQAAIFSGDIFLLSRLLSCILLNKEISSDAKRQDAYRIEALQQLEEVRARVSDQRIVLDVINAMVKLGTKDGVIFLRHDFDYREEVQKTEEYKRFISQYHKTGDKIRQELSEGNETRSFNRI